MARSVQSLPKLGAPVPGWKPPVVPSGGKLRGSWAEVVALNARHADALFAAYRGHDQLWDYLPYGPFKTVEEYRDWIEGALRLSDHQFYAIKNREADAVQGVASYLRIAPQNGSIEVGHLNFSPSLQATRAATEAMYLMMRWAFEAGYRRYEWKCDALNLPSRRAAQRLGLSYEGVFRQATIVKGRNRDTAWFATIDQEWPRLRKAFEFWLATENFSDGRQKKSLSALTAPLLVARDPALDG